MKNSARLASRALSLFTVGALVIAIASSPAAAAPTYIEGSDPQAFLFEPTRVNRLDITLPQGSIDALWEDPAGEYQNASMRLTTKKGVGPALAVGLRLKGGWGSFRDLNSKAAFKIKINHTVRAQRLFGLKKLTLNNMVQDPSMLHEATTYRLFRSMGIAAPRVGYMYVYINGVDYGLHANVETYDDVMLGRWFTSTKHLYEGSYGTEVSEDGWGGLEVDEGDSDDVEDIRGLAEANSLTGQAWYDQVSKFADLEQMTREWAVEHYVGHWDGYTRSWPNNYYLHSTNDGVFTMHPWGTDQTLDWYGPLLDEGALMTARCLEVPVCEGLYQKALREVYDKARALKLETMVADIWRATATFVERDPRKESDYGWATDVKNGTVEFAKNRLSELKAFYQTKKVSTLTVNYASPPKRGSYKPLKPSVTKSVGVQPTFRLGSNRGVCSVNSTTGVVTPLSPGNCIVQVDTEPTLTHFAESVRVKIVIPSR